MRYGLLGPVEIWAAGQVGTVDRPLRRAVLAYLLLDPNRVVSVERLTDAIWGPVAPSSAVAQLRSGGFRVRQVLREADLGAALATRSGGYQLTVDDGALDLDVFRAHVAQAGAAAAGGRHPEAADASRAAQPLWRGPALSGTAAGFVEAVRARLDYQDLGTHEELIDCELALGRHAEVLAELQALVDAHPLRERSSMQLMLALYRAGRQADAFDAFHRLRAALASRATGPCGKWRAAWRPARRRRRPTGE